MGKPFKDNGGDDPTKNQIYLDDVPGYDVGVFTNVDDYATKNTKNKVVLGTDGDGEQTYGDYSYGPGQSALEAYVESLRGDLTDDQLQQIANCLGFSIDFDYWGEGNSEIVTGYWGPTGDFVALGAGNDVMWGFGGDDIILAGAGNDNVWGGSGDDILLGEAGNDVLRGGSGDDCLLGGDDNDVLFDGDGEDNLNGGDGDDELHLDDDGDADHADGGSGIDTVYFDGWDKVDLASLIDTIVNVEIFALGSGSSTLVGTGADETLVGNELDNLIAGRGGDDVIYGMGGDDTLIGDDYTDGDDTIYGGSGNDTIWGDVIVADPADYDSDDLGAGAWDDMLYGNSGHDWIYGGDGDDEIYGGSGDDTLLGGDGFDTIYGGEGDDVINGGWWQDTVYGGAGNDLFLVTGISFGDDVYGGSGNDTLDVSGATGGDAIIADLGAGTYNFRPGGELFVADSVENVIGTVNNDNITGSDVANILNGNDGEDVINGGSGDDDIYGGTGDDTLTGGGDADDFIFNESEMADGDVDCIMDLTFGDGDRLVFNDLGGGETVTSLQDLLDLDTNYTEIDLEQVGNDAVITYDLGGGLSQDIILKNIDLPDFDGVTLDYTYFFPTFGTEYLGTNQDVVVGAGIELDPFNPDAGGIGTIDITQDDQIIIDYDVATSWTPASFNGFQLYDEFDSLPDFTNVEIVSNNMVGFSDANVSWDANNIWVEWNGLAFDSNTLIVLDVDFA